MSTYDDASLILYPSGYKEDKIYSLKPTDGSGDLTFTRASSATRVNSDGLIENAFVLGSELVTNGDFATDTDWTKTSTVTISSGNAHIISDGSYQYLAQNTILTIGKKYKITYEIIENTLGLLKSNTTFGVTTLDSSVGVHTFEAVAANASLLIERVSSCNIKIDNVSVKEVITLNVPRIDYTGGGCGKLLLEPQRTNLQLYSEDFRNVAEGGLSNTWTPNDTIILSTNNTAPDGTLSATRIRGTSGGNKARQAVIFGTLGAPYSGSIFIRRVSGTTSINLRVGDVGQVAVINPTSAWQRFTHTASPTSTAIRLAVVFTNDTDEFEIWGAQLEAASYATSYIPTTTTAVTRLADAASKTGISSLIGQTEGTMFVEAKVTINGRLMLIGTGGNFIEVLTNSAGKVNGFVRTSVTEANILSAATYATGDTLKIAFAYKVNDFALYVNGTAQGTDTSGNVPTGMAQLIVNDYTAPGYNSANAYSQALLFPTRLTNTQLATLTTI